MGNYRARRKDFLLGWQINAAECMFRGMDDKAICMKVFGVSENDERGLRNGKARLRNLRKDEKFQEYYRSLITEWSVHHAGKALLALSKQIDDPNPWVVNKAANDVLLQSKQFLTGVDDNTVVVKFENMPEIGSPDED